jgi:hypothetical protein
MSAFDPKKDSDSGSPSLEGEKLSGQTAAIPYAPGKGPGRLIERALIILIILFMIAAFGGMILATINSMDTYNHWIGVINSTGK